jgi:hypothetical protein
LGFVKADKFDVCSSTTSHDELRQRDQAISTDTGLRCSGSARLYFEIARVVDRLTKSAQHWRKAGQAGIPGMSER